MKNSKQNKKFIKLPLSFYFVGQQVQSTCPALNWLKYSVLLYSRKLSFPFPICISCRQLLDQEWDPVSTSPSQYWDTAWLELVQVLGICYTPQPMPV